MKYLGKIDEGKDLITQEQLIETSGESYPIYLPNEQGEITAEGKEANKNAYDFVMGAFESDANSLPWIYPAFA